MTKFITILTILAICISTISCELIFTTPAGNIELNKTQTSILYRIFGKEFVDANMSRVFYADTLARVTTTSALAMYDPLD